MPISRPERRTLRAGLAAMLVGVIGLVWLGQLDEPPAQEPTAFPTPPSALALEKPPALDEVAAAFPTLASILADEALGSIYKEFLVAYETGGPEAAEQLARDRGLLTARDEIQLSLVIDSPENTAAVVAELERYRIAISSYARDEVNVRFPLRAFEILAESTGAPQQFFLQLTEMEHVVQVRLPVADRPSEELGQQAVTGEGVASTLASAWHEAGFGGQSVRIGILDIEFGGYRALLGSELPAEVAAYSSASGVTDLDATHGRHGTACAEIIHEMAPNAEIYLAHYDGSFASKIQAVEWLLAQEVDIISASIGTPYGPKDGSGRDARLVDDVAALGILWVSAAGNEAESHLRAKFSDVDSDGQHEFFADSELLPLRAQSSNLELLLQWDDWGDAKQDYNLHLYDADFELLAASTDIQTGGPGAEPVERIVLTGAAPGSIYYVAVSQQQASHAAVFDLYASGAQLAYYTPEYSLTSPADARGAYSVGAVTWNSDVLERYSSWGPTDDGRLKPEIVAPTNVSGYSYGREGFSGTSAAAPHVAGAAALLWGAHPEYDRDTIVSILDHSSVDVALVGPDTGTGFGLLRLISPTFAIDDVAGQLQTPHPAFATPIPTPIPWLPGGTTAHDQSSAIRWPFDPRVVGLAGLTCVGAIAFLAGLVLVLLPPHKRQQVYVAAEDSWLGAVQQVATEAPTLLARTTKRSARSNTQEAATSLAWLEFMGERYQLGVDRNTIGRVATNDVCIDDNLVSRKHADIFWDGDIWAIRDRSSHNGVFVNGKRVQLFQLHSGDTIQIGNTFFVFRASH